jgi:hypothetical protein
MKTIRTSFIVPAIAALSVGYATAEQASEMHAHTFSSEVDALHSVLAPLWHAPVGKERSQNVCARTPALEKLAKEIRGADAKPLLASITALAARCQSNPSDIDTSFRQVHEAFHHLIESTGH